MSEVSVIRVIHEYNLCATYLLPLLELNQFNFGPNNFVNTYVDLTGTKLAVRVYDRYGAEDPYKSNYHIDLIEDGNAFMHVFRLSARWSRTFQLFRQGKYSEFPDVAKRAIIKNSGLKWKQEEMNGAVISDARLLALYRSPLLISKLSEELNIPQEMLTGELIQPPKHSEFIEL